MTTPSGVSVKASVEFDDYLELGRGLAHKNSEQQAAVLLGLALGIDELGGPFDALQLSFIGDAVKEMGDTDRKLVVELLADLVFFIDPEVIS